MFKAIVSAYTLVKTIVVSTYKLGYIVAVSTYKLLHTILDIAATVACVLFLTGFVFWAIGA